MRKISNAPYPYTNDAHAVKQIFQCSKHIEDCVKRNIPGFSHFDLNNLSHVYDNAVALVLPKCRKDPAFYECENRIAKYIKDRNYAAVFCPDGLNPCYYIDSVIISREKPILNHKLRDKKKDKMPCDVFGCSFKEDSSFFMIMKDTLISRYDNDWESFAYPIDVGYTGEALISRYNKEYLLISNSSYHGYGSTYYDNKISLKNNKSQHISKILPACKINSYDISIEKQSFLTMPADHLIDKNLFSPDSKCNLNPLIAKLSPKINSLCFRYKKYDARLYTLLKENNIIDKTLELKFESVKDKIMNDSKLEILALESPQNLLSTLFYIKAKYGYDILYIHSFKQQDFYNLAHWRGVRIKEQSEKNQSLFNFLFDATENCSAYNDSYY
jgi:hypothetical protein